MQLDRLIRDHASLILSVTAVGGVVVTGVLACRGQIKADEILQRLEQELIPVVDAAEVEEPVENEYVPVSFKEKAKVTWKCYVPAGVAGSITMACIIGSQYISAKQIAALTGTVALFVANRNQLENAIREKYGEEALDEIKSKLAIRKPNKEEVRKYERSGHGELLCCECQFQRWFRSDEDFVKAKCKEFSDRFKNGEYLAFNDLYLLWDIEPSGVGDQFGYPACEDCYDIEDGIPFKFTRQFNQDIMEDVLYIELAPADGGYGYPVYPMECWLEY